MSVTEGQIRGKYVQDTNAPRSNPAISQIQKNIERHAAHTIVSLPNPKQWVIVPRYIYGKHYKICPMLVHIEHVSKVDPIL